jgi:hypothetical protein
VKSFTTGQFWDRLRSLPQPVRRQAREAYKLFQTNPSHPSLHFKQIDPRLSSWSVRINIDYRALGIRERDRITWYWIGSHADYDRLV